MVSVGKFRRIGENGRWAGGILSVKRCDPAEFAHCSNLEVVNRKNRVDFVHGSTYGVKYEDAKDSHCGSVLSKRRFESLRHGANRKCPVGIRRGIPFTDHAD